MKTREKVLQALQDTEEYRSGEEISALCGVSRVAVWKQIQNLQAEGYEIESQHGKGYRLVKNTDRIQKEDMLQRFGGIYFGGPMEIRCFEEIDSTNLELKRQLLAGGKNGSVVTADHQTAGRGRLGRQWTEEKGSALTFSVLLEPGVPLEQTSRYSFVMAVSVAEGIADVTGMKALLKWPNDVLVEGKKVCGILLELVAEMAQVQYIIAGIGINVNQKPEDFSEEVREKAASLAMLKGEPFARADVLEGVLRRIEENVQLMQMVGFEPIRTKWDALSCVNGKEIQVVQYGRPVVQGLAEGIDENGALLVRTSDGMQTVVTGDVSLRDKDGGYNWN